MGTTRSRARFSSHSICQGTMFEWCSSAVTSTSSPSETRRRPKVCATRFTASVVPRTKITSRGSGAPMKRATASRAPS